MAANAEAIKILPQQLNMKRPCSAERRSLACSPQTSSTSSSGRLHLGHFHLVNASRLRRTAARLSLEELTEETQVTTEKKEPKRTREADVSPLGPRGSEGLATVSAALLTFKKSACLGVRGTIRICQSSPGSGVFQGPVDLFQRSQVLHVGEPHAGAAVSREQALVNVHH